MNFTPRPPTLRAAGSGGLAGGGQDPEGRGEEGAALTSEQSHGCGWVVGGAGLWSGGRRAATCSHPDFNSVGGAPEATPLPFHLLPA